MKNSNPIYKDKSEILKKLHAEKRKIKTESEALARKIQPEKNSKSVKRKVSVDTIV